MAAPRATHRCESDLPESSDSAVHDRGTDARSKTSTVGTGMEHGAARENQEGDHKPDCHSDTEPRGRSRALMLALHSPL